MNKSTKRTLLIVLTTTVTAVVAVIIYMHHVSNHEQYRLTANMPSTNPPPDDTIEAGCWQINNKCVIRQVSESLIQQTLRVNSFPANKLMLSNTDLQALGLPATSADNTHAIAAKVVWVPGGNGRFVLYECNGDVWVRHESLGDQQPIENVIIIIYLNRIPRTVFFDGVSAM